MPAGGPQVPCSDSRDGQQKHPAWLDLKMAWPCCLRLAKRFLPMGASLFLHELRLSLRESIWNVSSKRCERRRLLLLLSLRLWRL